MTWISIDPAARHYLHRLDEELGLVLHKVGENAANFGARVGVRHRNLEVNLDARCGVGRGEAAARARGIGHLGVGLARDNTIPFPRTFHFPRKSRGACVLQNSKKTKQKKRGV